MVGMVEGAEGVHVRKCLSAGLPAKASPDIGRTVLRIEIAQDDRHILDPFSGSGTTVFGVQKVF
jgi:hypothetical protein